MHLRCGQHLKTRLTDARSICQGDSVNRYEALHALGLDETATERDVRLAAYGIEKALASQTFQGEDKLCRAFEAIGRHCQEARAYLLTHKKSVKGDDGLLGSVFKKKVPESKLSISAEESAGACIKGYQLVQIRMISMREHHLSRVRSCVPALLLCIVVGFIMIRYLRGTPRYAVGCLLLAVIICVSVVLTDSSRQIRAIRRHFLDMDQKIQELGVRYGLVPERLIQLTLASPWYVRAWRRVRRLFHRLYVRLRVWLWRRRKAAAKRGQTRAQALLPAGMQGQTRKTGQPQTAEPECTPETVQQDRSSEAKDIQE